MDAALGRLRLFAGTLTLIGVTASQGMGQSPTGAIVGAVLSDWGGGIAYASVQIVSTGREQFADAHGHFRFDSLPLGATRIRVGQVGQLPLERTVIVSSGNLDTVFVSMSIANLHAPTVKVAADTYCGRSWSAANGDSSVKRILDQLFENADHNRLLVRGHPFQFTMAREFGYLSGQKRDTGLTSIRRDTVVRQSDRPWRYAPGRLTDAPPSGDGLGAVLNLLELADVADTTFLDNHCWHYRGIEAVNGERMLRLDFEPAKTIRVSDVSGSFFLDTATYRLRQSLFDFTRSFTTAQSVQQRISVETEYRDQRTGVPVAVQVISIVDRTIDPQCLTMGVDVVCPSETRIITRETQRLLTTSIPRDSTFAPTAQ